jgi:hypothetical protein
MVSTKKFIVDGNTKSFISDFIIKSEEHVRVYIYEYKPDCTSDCEKIGDKGYYIRQIDAPLSNDLVSVEKYELIDNRISFYNKYIPKGGLTLWIEVATNSNEFGDVLTTPLVEEAKKSAEEAKNSLIEIKEIEEDFNEKYLGSLETEPTEGFIEGSMFYNNNIKQLKIYKENGWEIVPTFENLSASWKDVTGKPFKSVKEYGAIGDGVTDDTLAIQNAINSGNPILLEVGNYLISNTLIIKKGTIIYGFGKGNSIITLAYGSNCDMIKSENFDNYTGGEYADVCPTDIILKDFSLNGNYFEKGWLEEDNVKRNTSGAGIKLYARRYEVDLHILNIAGVGFYTECSGSEGNDKIAGLKDTNIKLYVLQTGKEGVIFRGPSDIIFEKGFVGLAGALITDEQGKIVPTSDYYPDTNRIDGIVFDRYYDTDSSKYIYQGSCEIGKLHSYGCWNGLGINTVGKPRIKADQIISESNLGGMYLTEYTRTQISNLAIFNNIGYENGKGDNPGFNPFIKIDTKYAPCIISNLELYRTLYGSGEDALQINGGNISIEQCSLFNSTDSNGNKRVGNGIVISGYNNNISFMANAVNGYALVRDTVSNSKRNNRISGNIIGCTSGDESKTIGFKSIGTPTSELIDLTMELYDDDIPFEGDSVDEYGRAQNWNIVGNTSNSRFGTRIRKNITAGTDFDETITDEQVVTIPHEYLYKPNFMNVSFTIGYDTGNISNGEFDYVRLNDITDTDLVFKIKMKTAATSNNTRIIVKID